MKILMLSIFAPHFFNWTEQLRDSGHEVYWLDIFDSNTSVKQLDFVHQIIGWRYKLNYPGRYFLKRNAPKLTNIINKVNERDLEKTLEAKLEEIKPDVVHSFVMYLATAPVLKVLKRHPEIKWIYSSWGSDLYYYRNKPKERLDMQKTLPEIDYLFTDCYRDYHIAVENGFNGEFLGVFPGGGGFDFKVTDPLIKVPEERKLILIKGYQGLHGKCISVLKALLALQEELRDYKLQVFGANEEVKNYVADSNLRKWENLEILGKIPHAEVMELMGEALIYIGNSLSDGTPNTLLEAIVMGAFPVQSNPGGATEEWIEDGLNGRLIHDPVNVGEILLLLKTILMGNSKLLEGIKYNLEKIKPRLEREAVRKRVLSKYRYIEQNLNRKPIVPYGEKT